MTVSVGQVKGLVAVCLLLAIIPFISFCSLSNPKNKLPTLVDQKSNSNIVQIKDSDRSAVYFVEPELSVHDLLKLTYGRGFLSEDVKLKDGMKIIMNDDSGKTEYALGQMDVPERLAMGMPVNLNCVTEDDLFLIPGIGEATAIRILEWRGRLGRFDNMKQLTEIKGIKDKKLAHLKKYLYVE
jgi:hypothetical protein